MSLALELRVLLPSRRVAALGTVGALDGLARTLEAGTPAWALCRATYVEKFPEAESITQLGNFRWVAIEPKGARHITGFGAARSIGEDEIKRALGPAGQ